jgi:hypothetical protein
MKYTSYPAYEDETDRVFRNVGKLQSDAGEIPKRIHTRFKTRRKFEIKPLIFIDVKLNVHAVWSVEYYLSCKRIVLKWFSKFIPGDKLCIYVCVCVLMLSSVAVFLVSFKIINFHTTKTHQLEISAKLIVCGCT